MVVQEIERSIMESPKSWFVHLVAGQLYREIGEDKRAMELFRKVLTLKPDIEIMEIVDG